MTSKWDMSETEIWCPGTAACCQQVFQKWMSAPCLLKTWMCLAHFPWTLFVCIWPHNYVVVKVPEHLWLLGALVRAFLSCPRLCVLCYFWKLSTLIMLAWLLTVMFPYPPDNCKYRNKWQRNTFYICLTIPCQPHHSRQPNSTRVLTHITCIKICVKSLWSLLSFAWFYTLHRHASHQRVGWFSLFFLDLSEPSMHTGALWRRLSEGLPPRCLANLKLPTTEKI